MRNPSLHAELEALTIDAGPALRALASDGDGLPYEVMETQTRGAGGAPLYCYRPLTDVFVRKQSAVITALQTYDPVAQTLAGVGGLELYLRARGVRPGGDEHRDPVELALLEFLAHVYHESTEFAVDPARFTQAYAELERTIYEGRCVSEVVAPLYGIDLDPETRELMLGEGLAIVRSHRLAALPAELAGNPAQPLLVLRVAHDRIRQPSPAFARQRFDRVLTALRLYDRGAYAVGPLGYTRVDGGPWTAVVVGSGGRRDRLTLIPSSDEEELRLFCNTIGRRLARGSGAGSSGDTRTDPLDNSGAGEVAWALARFEMGCERPAPLQALTDHLIALRALLEPEGPASGRLTQRVAVICAPPLGRAALAERIAAAVALERSVIAGLSTPQPADAEALVDEVAEHLRAILRDVLCGHLAADLCAVADQLLAESIEPESLAA